ncbi:unnamed protein product [Rotaria sordida]|uniref:Uncharacterized protein n=1 Tax=Rotaria sordida TaxID=392033 RepID=A0A813ZEN6_9BILA|nr:unnamed protein product [Rotaria sordida]
MLIAVNYCGSSVTIVDIATLSFPGMAQDSIVKVNSSYYYNNLTWTPTAAQIGYQVMCAMAFDSQNSQSDQYCFKFYVSTTYVCSCPGEVCITTTSTTSTTSTSTTKTTSTSTTTTTSTSTTATTSTSTTATTTTTTTSTTSTTSTTTSSTSTTSTTTTTTTTTTSGQQQRPRQPLRPAPLQQPAHRS